MDTFSLVPHSTLLTEIPGSDRQLAAQIDRSVIRKPQPYPDKREHLRDIYADDPRLPLANVQSAATAFATSHRLEK